MPSNRNPSQLSAFSFMAIVRRTAESAVETALAAARDSARYAELHGNEATDGAMTARTETTDQASELLLAPHELRARCGVLPRRTVNFRGSYGTAAPLPAHLMDLRR